MADEASQCSSGMLTAQTDDHTSERSYHRGATTFVAAGAAHSAAMALRYPGRRTDDDTSGSSNMATPPGSFSSLPVPEEDFDRMFQRIVRFSAGASGEAWLVHMTTPAPPSIGASDIDPACQGTTAAEAVVEQYAMKVTNFYNRSGGEARRERLRTRALREIECLQRCQPHPLVVRYVAHRYTDAALELVMELVEGGDLGLQMAARMQPTAGPGGDAQAVSSYSYYSEAEALFYFVQACVAVHSLHERGILHRDIKSGNFLCVSNGLLKLADFGFAKDFAPAPVMSERVCTEFLGTPAFLAPEVWTGEGYGGKAEVWSLGVMLYQLLTLRLPFGGSTMESLRRRVCAGEYLPIAADRVSVQTRALVQWMLTVEHDRRPTVAQVLATGHMQWTLQQFCTLCRRREFLTHNELQLLEQRSF